VRRRAGRRVRRAPLQITRVFRSRFWPLRFAASSRGLRSQKRFRNDNRLSFRGCNSAATGKRSTRSACPTSGSGALAPPANLNFYLNRRGRNIPGGLASLATQNFRGGSFRARTLLLWAILSVTAGARVHAAALPRDWLIPAWTLKRTGEHVMALVPGEQFGVGGASFGSWVARNAKILRAIRDYRGTAEVYYPQLVWGRSKAAHNAAVTGACVFFDDGHVSRNLDALSRRGDA